MYTTPHAAVCCTPPQVGLPNAAQRKAILRGYLRRHAAEVPNSVHPELLAEGPTQEQQQQQQPAANGHAATANGDVTANGSSVGSGAVAERRSTSGGSGKPTGLGGAGLAAAGGKAAAVKAGRTATAAGSTSPTGKSGATAATAAAGAVVVQPAPAPAAVSALDAIAAATEGFSGSDLLELCAQAAQRVLAEHLHAVVARWVLRVY